MIVERRVRDDGGKNREDVGEQWRAKWSRHTTGTLSLGVMQSVMSEESECCLMCITECITECIWDCIYCAAAHLPHYSDHPPCLTHINCYLSTLSTPRVCDYISKRVGWTWTWMIMLRLTERRHERLLPLRHFMWTVMYGDHESLQHAAACEVCRSMQGWEVAGSGYLDTRESHWARSSKSTIKQVLVLERKLEPELGGENRGLIFLDIHFPLGWWPDWRLPASQVWRDPGTDTRAICHINYQTKNMRPTSHNHYKAIWDPIWGAGLGIMFL